MPLSSTPFGKKKRNINLVSPSTSPIKHPRKRHIPGTPRKAKNLKKECDFKNTATEYLQQSQYIRLINFLMAKSPSFKQAFRAKAVKEIRKEIYNGRNKINSFRKVANLKHIQQFNWDSCLTEVRRSLPFSLELLKGMLSSKRGEVENFSGKRTKIPVIGTILAMILYSRTKSNKLFQAVSSIVLWKGGASNMILTALQHIGICMGPKGTRNAVDRICADFKAEPEKLKKDIENEFSPELSNLELSDPETMSILSDINPLQEDMSDFNEEESMVEESMVEESMVEESIGMLTIDDVDNSVDDLDKAQDPLVTTDTALNSDIQATISYSEFTPDLQNSKCRDYSVCWDNIQINTTARKQCSTNGNGIQLWALAYAMENRINFHSLENELGVKTASELDLNCFLPSSDDYNLHRQIMIGVVQNILKENFPWTTKCVSSPMNVHEHFIKSKEKSKLMNLGVIQENPATTAGCIQIMEQLHAFVPVLNNNRVYPILSHGDGLTCERSYDAMRARAASRTPKERLEGLIPCPGEFHKRMLLLQDTYDLFFSGSSAADKGTLFNIKQNFKHRSAKKQVSSAFNHCYDLVSFSTEALACTLAMQIMGTNAMDEKPADFQGRRVQLYLRNVSEKIVETVWQPFDNIGDVIDSTECDDGEDTGEDTFCFCNEDTGEEMITCSNLDCCPNGRWFHLSCVNLEEDEIPEGDWWCGDICAHYSIYCSCKRVLRGVDMINCANPACKRKRFHPHCIGLADANVAAGWVCPSCPENFADGEDADDVLAYMRALLWRGLGHLTRRQSIRENDGPAMIAHWKIDMPMFWENNHYKYLIIGHRLLAGVSGWQPERIKSNLIWNRTVNLSGGPHSNLEVDIVNEFLNRDFLEILKKGNGRYTKDHIARAGHIVGDIGKAADSVFKEVTESMSLDRHQTKQERYRNDVPKFIENYKDDQLFCHIPGRKLSGFPDFNYKTELTNPGKFKSRLRKYSKKLDELRDVIVN